MILTVSEQEPDLYASLRVGAAGYLLKDIAPGELIEAVLAAGRGEPRIPASMAAGCCRSWQGAAPSAPTRSAPSASASARCSRCWRRACATARSPSGS